MIDAKITTISLLYLALNKSIIVTPVILLEIMANFFPIIPRVKKAVGTWIQAKSTHPNPNLYAIPGPPIKELAPT